MTDKRLTKAQMEHIHEAITAGDWSNGVVETFRCFGVDLADPDGPQVNPGDYRIPESQWHEICQWCIDSTGSVITRVNHGLDWMNYGPSTYPEEVHT